MENNYQSNATNNQNMATISTIENKAKQTTSKNRTRKPSDAVWICLNIARRMFENLPEKLQNTENKRLCLKEAALKAHKDPTRTFYEVQNESKKLTNLVNFNDYCKTKELNSEIVATHVVFEGKTVMRRVMEQGLEIVLGEKIEMFKESLTNLESKTVATKPAEKTVATEPAESVKASTNAEPNIATATELNTATNSETNPEKSE